MRKEFPLEDQSRIDKDDEMFGRGGTIDFGTSEVREEPRTISEADKDKTWL
jgi:NADH-quinone oxidoreductase subunit C